MWIFTVLIGLSVGAWIGTRYSITILATTVLVCDVCLLVAGLAAGWGMLYLALILSTATIALQAGYFVLISQRSKLAGFWRLHPLRSVTDSPPKR
jgi:hypothetical protein